MFILKYAKKISEFPSIIAVKNSLVAVFPITVIGSFATMIINLPINRYQSYMDGLYGPIRNQIFALLIDSTSHLLSLFIAMLIAYRYIKEYTRLKSLSLDAIIGVLIAGCSLEIILGFNNGSSNILDVTSVLEAIIISLLSVMIFVRIFEAPILRFSRLEKRLNRHLYQMIRIIVPMFFTFLIMVTIKIVLNQYGYASIQSLLFIGFREVIFSEGLKTLIDGINYSVISHVLWFFGIHGSNVMDSVLKTYFDISALSIGQSCSNIPVLSKDFFNTFVLVGGGGSSLSLIIAILVYGKNKRMNDIAKISILPVAFNVNELLLYGIPLIFNPLLLLPFIMVPLVFIVVTWMAMSFDIIPMISESVHWTTPIFLSGTIATGSIKGGLLQILNLVIGTLIYYPFVLLSHELEEKVRVHRIKKFIENTMNNELVTRMNSTNEDISEIERELIRQLSNDIKKNEIELFYQPLINKNGTIYGVEVLLRWTYNNEIPIPPPIVIGLLSEGKLFDRFNVWMINRVFTDVKKMDGINRRLDTISVNLSPEQLEETNFVKELIVQSRAAGIDPSRISIEITEETSIRNNTKIMGLLKLIKENKFRLSMDDFGAGHTSLLYLREFHFDTVKLDATLVKSLLIDAKSEDIIVSIISLSKSMDFNVIGEYVESKEHYMRLKELGCNIYQGYYFSRPLPLVKLVEYMDSFEMDLNVLDNV